jgi:hypothetical protein
VASEIPYMESVANLSDILSKIRTAGSPPKFTHEFLSSTLGFKGSRDRGVIKVLKALGFLTADSIPTQRYNQFKDERLSRAVMAAGIRDGWADVFLADEKSYERTQSQLVGIFKNVTGKGEAVAQKMASTFKALAAQADWQKLPEMEAAEPEAAALTLPREMVREGRVSLHQDVHIHLPATSDVAVYTAIFRALREELLD